MQARERQATTISDDRTLITTPQEDATGTAATSEEPIVRCMFGTNVDASCFAEQERVRQMQTLMVMWSGGFVCRSLIVEIDLLADFFSALTIHSASSGVVEVLCDQFQPSRTPSIS